MDSFSRPDRKDTLTLLKWNNSICPPDRGKHETLMEYGNQVLPAPTNLAHHPFWLGDRMKLNTWKIGSPQDQLTPKWNGHHLVILITPSALRLQGITLRAHHTRVKEGPRTQPSERQPEAMFWWLVWTSLWLEASLPKNKKVWPGIFRTDRTSLIVGSVTLNLKQ